ncbi:MAG TPA: methyltransferase domain-containing protein [Usitatibacter sp.]|nr:methyltransferase domain-containing protein [Usitatibacter sp.]
MSRVLNVGGGSKTIPIPAHYDGWEHVLLDIDAAQGPDVVCDARNLASLPAELYDAIYCSHNLEHYYRHDVPRVLTGFAHVLRPRGFAEVRVPDLMAVFAAVSQNGLELDAPLYESSAGPITANDVVYGFGKQIAASGNDYYAHKNAFTKRSISERFQEAGFPWIFVAAASFEIRALAFRQEPTGEQRALLGLPK